MPLVETVHPASPQQNGLPGPVKVGVDLSRQSVWAQQFITGSLWAVMVV